MKWPSEVFMVSVSWATNLACISFRMLMVHHYSPSLFPHKELKEEKGPQVWVPLWCMYLKLSSR